MNLCRTTAVLSAELLEEKVVPMGPCENAGQPDEVPVVVGDGDDDEEDEDEDFDDDEDDEDDEDVGADVASCSLDVMPLARVRGALRERACICGFWVDWSKAGGLRLGRVALCSLEQLRPLDPKRKRRPVGRGGGRVVGSFVWCFVGRSPW